MGEPGPVPGYGWPGSLHSYGDQLQHARLLGRSVHQHHGLVLQHSAQLFPQQCGASDV